MEKITESNSRYNHLEKMTVNQLLENINAEDQTVPLAVKSAIPAIAALCEAAADRMLAGGRLIYMGAGTSGRLGIVDASECPPTFGIPHGVVIGLIAGGDSAIRKAVEFAEDDVNQGWKDLQQLEVSPSDFVIGIAASGTTPYVLGALKACKNAGIGTGSITCNPGSPIEAAAGFPVVVAVGPEFVTGSTRMKAGTAQKLVLNMISTTLMIKLGRVEGNKMVNMQLSNEKLIERGIRMIIESTGTDRDTAKKILLENGSVKKAISFLQSSGN